MNTTYIFHFHTNKNRPQNISDSDPPFIKNQFYGSQQFKTGVGCSLKYTQSFKFEF